jgi:subtilisin family serine protease
MGALDLVRLTALMARTKGIPDIKIGLIDGPVATGHPNLVSSRILQIGVEGRTTCARTESFACLHGTFVAGILSAQRDSTAPAICPDCTLVIRPIFAESLAVRDQMPSATPRDLASAIIECIGAGARILNLSLGVEAPSTKGERALDEALNQALRQEVIVVAAAGNQGTLGTSAITRHPWVIPVVACDGRGHPISDSNLGGSIGRRGLRAPGDKITSLASEGGSLTLGGTSVAAPFVTGATALLWSEFPATAAAEIKLAISQATRPRRNSVVPPLLDAQAAYESLVKVRERDEWYDKEGRQYAAG